MYIIRRVISWVTAAILAGGCAQAAIAQGAPIITYTKSPQSVLSADVKKSINELAASTGSSAVYAIDVVPTALLSNVIQFLLPDGKTLIITKRPNSLLQDGYWAGETGAGGEASFFTGGKQLSGSIKHEGVVYIISPLPEGGHALQVRALKPRIIDSPRAPSVVAPGAAL